MSSLMGGLRNRMYKVQELCCEVISTFGGDLVVELVRNIYRSNQTVNSRGNTK